MGCCSIHKRWRTGQYNSKPYRIEWEFRYFFFFSYSLLCLDSVSVPFFSFECLSKMGRKDSSCVALEKILYCAPENESNFHGKHSQGCTEKANKESWLFFFWRIYIRKSCAGYTWMENSPVSKSLARRRRQYRKAWKGGLCWHPFFAIPSLFLLFSFFCRIFMRKTFR